MNNIKFRPMLFSTPMVQGLLNGNKTQTRRIINVKPNDLEVGMPFWHYHLKKVNVGDIICVRETLRQYFRTDENGYTDYDNQITEYKADGCEPVVLSDGYGFAELNKNGEERCIAWKPSIFMPRSACRIWLKVINIRVELLQNISESDAIKEGIICEWLDLTTMTFAAMDYLMGKMRFDFTAKDSYRSLWNSINGKDSWEKNPFVWVYEFEVLLERPEGFI